MITKGEVVAEYDKQRLPNYQVFDEKRYFSAGTEPCVISVSGIQFGLTICEDIWHDGPAAKARAAGAQVLINLNASPFHRGKQAERIERVREAALSHSIPILYINQVGGQDELVFDGVPLRSMRAALSAFQQRCSRRLLQKFCLIPLTMV